ncbi:MAG: response regulator [Myxococcales bacterium]|nr:response regulator [Myxococcales bacterium]
MDGQPRTVLVVDDDPDFLFLLRELLEGHGFRTVVFESRAAATAWLADHRPDLVVSDLMMDALDAGFSFARWVKEQPSLAGVPVLIVTAVGSALGLDFAPRTPAELEALHADGYLEKPVSPTALLERIHALLGTAGEERLS